MITRSLHGGIDLQCMIWKEDRKKKRNQTCGGDVMMGEVVDLFRNTGMVFCRLRLDYIPYWVDAIRSITTSGQDEDRPN